MNKDYKDRFPDGTEIPAWFREIPSIKPESFQRQYRLDDAGIFPGEAVQTEKIQALIEQAAGAGGGVILVPPGRYLSGALHFRQNVSLYLEQGAVLTGSDDLRDFPLCETRIEGQNCLYFPALINAEGLDGFTIAGEGIIDGNGLRFWEDFWLRRQWNPACTNKDTQRPRLVFLSGCSDVLVNGVTLQNSPFWTNHLYERIVIEDCEYGFCHGCLTFGSENIHTRNIVMRNIRVSTGYNLLWMKLRPDTPQIYEHVLVENISGKAANFLNINPWSQFFDLQGRTDLPKSVCRNVTIRNCRFDCDTFFNVKPDPDHYSLEGFELDNLEITAANTAVDPNAVFGLTVHAVHTARKAGIDYPDSVTTLTDDNTVIS